MSGGCLGNVYHGWALVILIIISSHKSNYKLAYTHYTQLFTCLWLGSPASRQDLNDRRERGRKIFSSVPCVLGLGCHSVVAIRVKLVINLRSIRASLSMLDGTEQWQYISWGQQTGRLTQRSLEMEIYLSETSHTPLTCQGEN